MARGKTGAAVAAAVLLLLVGLAIAFRGPLLGLLGRGDEPTEVSPEAAASAEAKLEHMGADHDTVRLSAVEITSLMRYRAPASALRLLRDPSVQIAGDTLRLSGMVPTDRLPAHPDLDRVRLLLPDTARLVVRGSLATVRPGHAALQIRSVEFAGIPIPTRYYPAILERLGRRDEPGLDPAAVGISLPPQVATARAEGGYLVLTPASD